MASDTRHSKSLFTWSGGLQSSWVGFFCFQALGDTKQKKPTPLDRGPPLHVNRVLNNYDMAETTAKPLIVTQIITIYMTFLYFKVEDTRSLAQSRDGVVSEVNGDQSCAKMITKLNGEWTYLKLKRFLLVTQVFWFVWTEMKC